MIINIAKHAVIGCVADCVMKRGQGVKRTDRRNELWQFSKSLLEKIMIVQCTEINKGFADDGKHRVTFMAAVTNLFTQLRQRQQEGRKGVLHHVALHVLGSSVLLNRAELMITAYEEDFLDDTEVSVFWTIDDLTQYVDIGITEISSPLRKEFERLQEYEIQEIKQTFLLNYTILMIPFVTELLPEVFQLPDYAAVDAAPEVDVVFGELMEKVVSLYVHRNNDPADHMIGGYQ